MEITESGIWYHGTNLKLTVLRENSTITQWKKLAEAFSHKPKMLCIDDGNQIVHNGLEYGYLYQIDEPITVGLDLKPHPRSAMAENMEYVTTRPLKLKLVQAVGMPDMESVTQAEKQLKQYSNKQ